MSALWKQALLGILRLQIILALALFLPAGSVRYWEGWVYWTVFFVGCMLITLYFLKHDPGLIARRLKAGPAAETEKSQKVIQAIAGVLSCGALLVPGLDHRFHWSSVPIPIVLAGEGLVALGFLLIFLVFRENSFASSAIEVAEDQKVIATGPYRVVRHPMYAGALLLFLGTPLALGSWWGLLLVVPLFGVLAARLLDEERYLTGHLAGYQEYCQRVRYHLIPFVW